MDKWISTDEIPDGVDKLVDRIVLVMCNTGLYAIGYKIDGEWYRDSDGRSFESVGHKVTHYQFLPGPPQILFTQQETDNWDESMDN